MSKIWALSRVMMKTAFDEQFNAFKGKKNSKLKTAILFGFLGIYLLGILLVFGYLILMGLIEVNQPSLFIFIINYVVPIVVIFFTLFSIPIILYYSNDNASYFTLPLKSHEIIAAKTLTIYLQTLITATLVMLPLYALYFINVGGSIISVLFALLSILIAPILPIVAAVLIIVLLFTFTPFFKSKEVFTYITTFIAVIFSVSISQMSVFMDADSNFLENLAHSIQAGNDGVMGLLSSIFPTTKMLSNAIVDASLIQLMFAIGVTAVACILLFVIVEPIYMKTVLLFSETKKSNKRFNKNQLNTESTQKSIVRAFMQYDFKNILRTPAFVANYYLPIILLPVILIFTTYSAISGSGALPMDEIHRYLNLVLSYANPLDVTVFFLTGSIIIGVFVANLGSTTLTGISREGMNAKEFLMFPLKLSDIIKAKIYNNLLTIVPILSLFVLVIGIVIGLPPYLLPVMILGILIGATMVTVFGIWVDMSSPRLVWANEQDAIKGNMRQIIVILPFIFASVIVAVVLINYFSMITCLFFSVISLVVTIYLVKHVLRFADTKLPAIIQNK